jgi:hypothetical protein
LPETAFLLVDTSTSLSYLTKDFTGGIIVLRVTLEQVGYKRKLSTHQLERHLAHYCKATFFRQRTPVAEGGAGCSGAERHKFNCSSGCYGGGAEQVECVGSWTRARMVWKAVVAGGRAGDGGGKEEERTDLHL